MRLVRPVIRSVVRFVSDPLSRAGQGAVVAGLAFLACTAGILATAAPASSQTFPMTPEEERAKEEARRRERSEAPSRILDLDDSRDPRSVELMRWDCQDEIGRHGVTLFANGTIRARRGPWDDQELRLEELGPLELGRYVVRLREIRADRGFPEQLQVRGGVAGRWIGQCRIALDLPGSEPVTLEVGSLDVLPHPLQQIRQLAEELESFTRPLRPPSRLPAEYEPRVGDVLVDSSGQGFRIIRWTLDGEGVEMDSLDGSRRIYMLASELPETFVRLESRGSRPPKR